MARAGFGTFVLEQDAMCKNTKLEENQSQTGETPCRALAVAEACAGEAWGTPAFEVHAGMHEGWGGHLWEDPQQREHSQVSPRPLHMARL